MLPRTRRSRSSARHVGMTACAFLLTACSGSPSPTVSPTPSQEPSSSAAETATPSASTSVAPIPSPTPDQTTIPLFAPGVEVATTVGVRLRGLPGVQWSVDANLPAGAKLIVVLGPVRTAGYGWYLVADADPAAPSFREDWVAAGFSPGAFLKVSNEEPIPSPGSVAYVAGWARDGDGDFGPFRVEGANYAIRWAAAVPTASPAGSGCAFQAALAPDGGQPVIFAKTTVGQAPAPGVVQATFFTSHPTLQGDLFLKVTSTCSWGVTVVRLPAI